MQYKRLWWEEANRFVKMRIIRQTYVLCFRLILFLCKRECYVEVMLEG